jgi:outer membrane receptor protein involved in Fe transport
LGDGSLYVIPAMLTYNATIDYRRDLFNTPTRFRFGVRNLFDERAPLADRFFGYFADAHRDLGRSFYIDLRMKFDGF